MNLSQYIVLPELVEEETVPFTAEEVERIWADYEICLIDGIALLMIYTGLMPGEISRIKRENWQGQFFTDIGIKTDRRKSAAVPIPDRLMPVVSELFAHGKNGSLLPYKMDTYRKEFKAMVERIGADARCTPYSCRHTFATLMKRVEGSNKDKLELIGHSSEEMLRYYQDVNLEDLRKITDRI